MEEALTWDALAVALNMPVREIYRARKMPGAPLGKKLAEWRDYFKSSNILDLRGLPPTTYDKAMEAGTLTPDDAVKHSRLVEQEIINEIKREELKNLRGETLTKDQHRERIASLADKVRAALADLPEIAAAELEPHERPAMRKKAEAWRDAILTKIADAIARGV